MSRLKVQRLIRRVHRSAKTEHDKQLSHRALDELGREWQRWLEANGVKGLSFEQAWERFSGKKGPKQ